jgi:hypothetical protein
LSEQRGFFNSPAAKFGGLIATIVVTLALPFIQQHPLLFYSVSDITGINENHLQTLEIKLDNYGTTQANNVLVSLKSTNVKFVKFDSEPNLPKDLFFSVNGSNQIGQGLFIIKVLPPQSGIVVTTTVNASLASPSEKVVAYAQSDQWIAYDRSDMSTIVILYAVVLSAFTTIFVALWKNYPLSLVLMLLTIIYAIVVAIFTSLPLMWKLVFESILVVIFVISFINVLRGREANKILQGYECMGCGIKHNQAACPNCGSKMKRRQ